MFTQSKKKNLIFYQRFSIFSKIYFHAIRDLCRWLLLRGSASSWACRRIHSMQVTQARHLQHQPGDQALRQAQRQQQLRAQQGRAQRNTHTDCGAWKPRVFFAQGPSEPEQLSYSVVVPIFNHFKESELWDAAMGDLGSSCLGNLVWLHERGMCRGSEVQPWGHWGCLLCRGQFQRWEPVGWGSASQRGIPVSDRKAF